jgi:protein-disulfide isomerase
VQANVDEAMALGINGTPFFFLDGYGLSGAQPYELFEAAVELAENDELDDVIEAQAREYYDAMVAQAEAMARQAAEPVEVSLENAHVIGDADAPVTIVEYTDFQCPYCARHALETFPQIEEDLVETGKVRYVFKDLPLISIHPQAMLAAEASQCAGAQDGYLAMHTKLFEEQETWSGQADAAELFAGYAAEIGLDGETFTSCLENHETVDAVQADMEEAISAGITGTPAFLINGRLVSGGMPFEAFEQAVEAAIAEGAARPAGN